MTTSPHPPRCGHHIWKLPKSELLRCSNGGFQVTRKVQLRRCPPGPRRHRLHNSCSARIMRRRQSCWIESKLPAPYRHHHHPGPPRPVMRTRCYCNLGWLETMSALLCAHLGGGVQWGCISKKSNIHGKLIIHRLQDEIKTSAICYPASVYVKAHPCAYIHDRNRRRPSRRIRPPHRVWRGIALKHMGSRACIH